jgi:basic amino acid/polyamine antiporter, APA family
VTGDPGRVTAPAPDRALRRGLGPWASASIVVGTIIGTGVFLKTAVMSQLGGSPGWVLGAWAVAGLLSLFGAMTYAELGGMFPSAGGEYVYLRRGYGPFMAYLYGWNRFWIATPGSVAAYAVGAATFLGTALDYAGDGTVKLIALGLILMFTAINCLNVRSGGQLQTVLTVMKVVMILGLAVGALATPHGSWSHLGGGAGGFPGVRAFGAMVLAALWAYDGWNNLPMAAGEIRDPVKNLPRATLIGVLAVLGIYALVNVSYFHALPFAEVVTARSDAHPEAAPLAAKVAAQFLGGPAQILLAVAMTLSALSAMNGSMLTGARVPYAAARDGLAPAALARLSAGAHVPTISVLVQGGLSCVLALSGSFDQLTDAVVFASWLFYALNAGSVLMLRRREPDRARPFRVPGFPVVPVVYVVLATLLLVNTVSTSPGPSALGLGMTALGGLVFVAFLRGKARPLVDDAAPAPDAGPPGVPAAPVRPASR